ncbi:MAG: HTH domain-containing protein [Sediminibacterium sp.]|nr:HTH domain-containing protein [Sediminibacterium sp.]
MPYKQFNRISLIDRLIRIKATGSPKHLANRLSISESTLYQYLAFMKELGAPITYCSSRRSYYYKTSGRFNLQFLGE